jgi:chitin disaccharide deacetylase
MKYVIITADDFGISPEINRGIVDAHSNGMLKTAAILMNAPSTDEAIVLARENSELEVGLHLSIVEGISLRGEYSSITDNLRYFNNVPCLHRDWKHFMFQLGTGQIRSSELRQELNLQFEKFADNFKSIPFVNGTQHMHLVPFVWGIVKELSLKYHVKGIRLPGFSAPNKLWLNKRFPFLIPFQLLGEMHRRNIPSATMVSPDKVEGLQFSGSIDAIKLTQILQHISSKGVTEIVMHPGYTSNVLRDNLPWAYGGFNWEWELEALKSPHIKRVINELGIELITYSDLKN